MTGKTAARARAIALRAEAYARHGDSAGLALAQRGLPVKAAGVVSGFTPFRDEISVLPLMDTLAGAGFTLALPVVIAKGEPLIFRRYRPGDLLVPGRWDILAPPETATELLPDLLLVPLLAFDRQGHRLGYGGGFYDRTLAKLRALKPITAIGVAYAAQEVGAVPRAPYDQPLDWIMTEVESFACR